jgi:hypothetical protein
MTDHHEARVRELVVELIDATPPLPEFSDLLLPRRKPRRAKLAVMALGLSLLVVVGIAVTLAVFSMDKKPGRVSMPDVRVIAPPRERALRYADTSKPPPIRMIAGTNAVDVTTVLGCWFHSRPQSGGKGSGYCADGIVDTSRVRLRIPPHSRVVLQLPIDADVSAHLGRAQPSPPPGMLPRPVENRQRVALARDTGRTWSFPMPNSNRDMALLIDLHVNTTAGGDHVSGDAHYGATLTRS